jgi:hypothetical protein
VYTVFGTNRNRNRNLMIPYILYLTRGDSEKSTYTSYNPHVYMYSIMYIFLSSVFSLDNTVVERYALLTSLDFDSLVL